MTEPDKIKYDLMCCLVLGGSEREKHEAMRNALMYIRDLETQELPDMKNLWVSVEERLPEEGKTVIVAFTDGYVTIGTLRGDFFSIPYSEYEQPVTKRTWWMPLPEPPEVTKT